VDLELGGRTAYITGGAHGIGAAVAGALIAEGVEVAVADVDVDGLAERAAEWRARSPSARVVVVVADLSSESGVDQATETVLDAFGGAPDLLVNNVGVADGKPFAEIPDEQWRRTFELDLMSYVRTARGVLPRMAAGSGGAVVNVASDLAKQPETMPADYGAMKAAVLSLTKSLALEYAPEIRVNAVLPGPVWTRLWSRDGGLADQLRDVYGVPTREEAVDRYLQDRRLTFGISRPEDVADSVLFLLSRRARQINGAALDVGGTVRSLY
jgi:NAD(P)-dependent dehydrogenase (short-subunit alcohol dehydrogenase family)